MKTLTLDLGTKLGWALGDTDLDLWLWGEMDFALGRYEGGGMRFVRFEKWLVEALAGVGLVVMEEVAFARFQQAAEVLNGMKAIVMAQCEKHEIPYSAVPVGTLKKFATGKGNCGKPEMAYALGERWADIRPRSHLPTEDGLTTNEVDAIWLLAYAERHLIPDEGTDGKS